MEKKLRRSLLLGVLVILCCSSLTGCGVPNHSDVSHVKATFANTTITVCSSTDTNFKLYIELKTDGETSFFTTGKLAITSTAPQAYNLKSLVGNYISDDAKIVSIKVNSVTITDYETTILIIGLAACLIGYFVGWFRTAVNKS